MNSLKDSTTSHNDEYLKKLISTLEFFKNNIV